MSISKSTAVLAAADLGATLRFYTETLGFEQRWLWGEPPSFGCIGLGTAELFICATPSPGQQLEGLMHCFDVDDVQALYEQHAAAKAPIVSPLETKPWNVREYTVRDPNGYHLRFMGTLSYERPATGLDALPSFITIDARMPDYESCAALFMAVAWPVDELSLRAALSRSLAGVIAVDTRDSQVVGMARATGDGRFYMIWDVVVRPSHQGQKIGTAMLQRLLDELRTRGAPAGAMVGLFTGKPGFYEQIGFRPLGGMSLSL